MFYSSAHDYSCNTGVILECNTSDVHQCKTYVVLVISLPLRIYISHRLGLFVQTAQDSVVSLFYNFLEKYFLQLHLFRG